MTKKSFNLRNAVVVAISLAVITMFSGCNIEENNFNVDTSLITQNKIQWTDTELQALYQMRGGNNRVSMEEVNLLANEAINLLDGNRITKSSASRRIATITPLSLGEKKKAALRSSSGGEKSISIPDTLAYIVNFADSTGFTIIAADTRVENPILAMAYSGTIGNEIENPGLGIFLAGAEAYITQSIIDAEQKKDSLLNDINAKLYYAHSDESDTKDIKPPVITVISVDIVGTGPWVITSTKGPLSPAEWGQGNEYGEAFWDNVKNKKSCGTCPAGCVAVATAHIMSYWQYPTSIGNSNFNWSLLNQYTGYRSFLYSNPYGRPWINSVLFAPTTIKTQFADLMEKIGVAVGTSYDCLSNGGSGADSDDAIQYLKSKGYSGGTKKGYDYNSVVSSLNNNRPVYARGYKNETVVLGIPFYSGGHAWVIDGHQIQKKNVTLWIIFTSPTPPKPTPDSEIISLGNNTYAEVVYTQQTSFLLYNNWGWAGIDNGWYLSQCFCNYNEGVFAPDNNGLQTQITYKYNNEIYVDLKH
jgi:hypothetical protein